MDKLNLIKVCVLNKDEAHLLKNVADDVFDNAIDATWSTEFFADERHHLAVALWDSQIIAMASALHYIHPDKAPELWINEVGVASAHQGKGIAKRLLHVLFEHAITLGCSEAWVLTEKDNVAAQKLYASVGGIEEAERPVYFTFRLS